jgi:hypothetical protein
VNVTGLPWCEMVSSMSSPDAAGEVVRFDAIEKMWGSPRGVYSSARKL